MLLVLDMLKKQFWHYKIIILREREVPVWLIVLHPGFGEQSKYLMLGLSNNQKDDKAL